MRSKQNQIHSKVCRTEPSTDKSSGKESCLKPIVRGNIDPFQGRSGWHPFPHSLSLDSYAIPNYIRLHNTHSPTASKSPKKRRKLSEILKPLQQTHPPNKYMFFFHFLLILNPCHPELSSFIVWQKNSNTYQEVKCQESLIVLRNPLHCATFICHRWPCFII